MTERSGLSLEQPVGGWVDVYRASIKAKGELDLNQHYSSSSATQSSVDAPGSVNSHLSFTL